MMRGREWRWSALGASSGVLVAAVIAVIGIPLGFAAAFGVLVAIAVIAWHGLPLEGATREDAERRPARPGTRPDVSSLTWALTSRGRGAGEAGLDRVREVARTRLDRHGIDPEDPRDRAELERLFGSEGMRLLTTRGGRIHSHATVERCLDVLDALDDLDLRVRRVPLELRPERAQREPSDHRQERDTA